MKKLLIFTLCLCFGCYRVPDKIDPQISCSVEESYIQKLPAPFKPITFEERKEEWAKEYLIGVAFAKELDLYRAITAFKRAKILSENFERKQEITYNILLCYYLGGKYDEVIETFEASSLARADTTFPAYHDLLIILYQSYDRVNAPQKAQQVLELLNESYPETGEKLHEADVLLHGNIEELHSLSKIYPDKAYLGQIADCYCLNKKSVAKAQILNGILPGAGYFYVGQTQSAITALLLNGGFITASYFFFKKGNVAAGVITTSFEAGWYFGGIYGAGESAKLYNERLYERLAYHNLQRENLFPVLRLRYAF
ncbi:MAG: tetratricopeptide repeat protein [Chlamydiales bacterium]|nr:tetratricopeptide repeat protein [Chlamydiales bacterium]